MRVHKQIAKLLSKTAPKLESGHHVAKDWTISCSETWLSITQSLDGDSNVVPYNSERSRLHPNDLTESMCRWHATRAADLSSQHSLVLDVSSPPPQVA